jgi:hypothetical protein
LAGSANGFPLELLCRQFLELASLRVDTGDVVAMIIPAEMLVSPIGDQHEDEIPF